MNANLFYSSFYWAFKQIIITCCFLFIFLIKRIGMGFEMEILKGKNGNQ